MKQIYHTNAKTNEHIRSKIKESELSNVELAEKYSISTNTVRKWKNRSSTNDLSSEPRNISKSLSQIQEALIYSLRTSTWMPLDEVHDAIQNTHDNQDISRSSVHRFFVKNKINRVPQQKREQAKKFKEYDPGFLHIDVTYLPKFNKENNYLFVAIDRATRLLFYKVYKEKTADNATDFMEHCVSFFPFIIEKTLTDNGLEFTNRLIISKKGTSCNKDSKFDKTCQRYDIIHRLTKPRTPKTNGMVERHNGIIKNGTILKEDYKNKYAMEHDLMRFLIFFIMYRRNDPLKNELKVRTPFEAVEKWFQLKPEIFHTTPDEFKKKVLNLADFSFFTSHQQQPCET